MTDLTSDGAISQSRQLALSSLWRNSVIRGWALQALTLVIVALSLGYFVHNAIDNMARVGIASGFRFLSHPANFAIGETMFPYASSDSYGRAILVGLANTIKVAAVGCVLTTFLGTLLGVLQLGSNKLLRGLVQSYIELIRNVPLLLQLFFWYAMIQVQLPGPRQAFNPLPGVFLSNRGVKIPMFEGDSAQLWVAAALLIGLIATILINGVNRRHRERTGDDRATWPWALALVVILPFAVARIVGAPFNIDVPTLRGFNFVGGATLTPEFAALLFGLTLYTSAFVAEIVRSGIQSVSKGQREAARSLGLSPARTMRMIILPQALRVIIPPITSSYLGLTKNSSLAVAIGYPDLVNVVNTTMNQTGQAVETVGLLMGVYLALSLGISAFMNWYNARVAIKER